MRKNSTRRRITRDGFSLVELIIVIAIMAILIGVIALAVIPNIQKSREAKDLNYLNSMLSGLNVAAATAEIESTDEKSDTIANLLNGSSDFAKAFKREAGDRWPDPSSTAARSGGAVARYKLTMSAAKRAEITVWYGSDNVPTHANSTNYTSGERSQFLISN